MTREKRDKYLRKKYNITLAEYEKMLERSGGTCWICGRPPKNLPLAVDHDHSVSNQKVTSLKLGKEWVAVISGVISHIRGTPRSTVISSAKRYLLRKSCRGVLCWKCNTGLKKYSDDPVLLHKASLYLERSKHTNGLNQSLY